MDRRLVQPASKTFLVRLSFAGQLRARSCAQAGRMIMDAKPSQPVICRDTKARGRSRSPLLELYTRSIFRGTEKNPRELLPPSAADCAWGVRLMETMQDQIRKLRRHTVHRIGATPRAQYSRRKANGKLGGSSR